MTNFFAKTLALSVLVGLLLLAGCARKEKKLDYSGDFASNTAVGDSILAADDKKSETSDLSGANTADGGELLGDSKPLADKNGNSDLEAMNNDDSGSLSAEEKIALSAKPAKGEEENSIEKKPAKKAEAKKPAKPIVKKVGDKKPTDKKTADAKKPTDKKAVTAKKAPAKKETEKAAKPKVVAVKKPAKKAEPKALAGSTTVARAEKAEVAKAATVLDLSRETYLSLTTFENDLEDMSVELTHMKPWTPTSPKAYAGQYTAQLGSEVGSVKFSPAAKPGQLNMSFGYSTESVSNHGLIEQKSGSVTYTNVILKEAALNWPRKTNLYVTQGQFVQWVGANGKMEYGFLARGKAAGKPEFVLLRKVKA